MKTKRLFRSRLGFTLVEVMVVVAIIGTFAAVAIPNYIKARQAAQKSACIANLKRIEEAKIYLALNGGTGTPTMKDIVPDYIKKTPVCPSGGKYSVNDMDAAPTCSLYRPPYDHILPGTSLYSQEEQRTN